jgi:hypothetical protein
LAADSIRASEIGETSVKKPILVVAGQFPKEVEERIDRDFEPRRNPNVAPFSKEQLLAAADRADVILMRG